MFMETKIRVTTPGGYMYLKDERMAVNAAASYTSLPNNIEEEMKIRQIIAPKVKSYHKIETPFGVAYVRSYDTACRRKYLNSKNMLDTDFNIVNVIE